MKLNRTETAATQGLIKPTAAAAFLGVSKRTLQDWRLSGTGPRFIRLSPRAVRYRLSDLEAWIAKRATGAAA